MLMLKNPLFASLLATLFTWFVTALGSAVVFVSKPTKSFLDGSLGFAGGVMVAASFWSLIAPSIEIAEGNGFGSLSFIPSAIGIVLGALFVDQAERMFPVEALLHLQQDVIGKKTNIKNGNVENVDDDDTAFVMSKNEKKGGKSGRLGKVQPTLTKRRGHSSRLPSIDEEMIISGDNDDLTRREAAKDHQEVSILTWKRTLMLAIAVTIHNIPEGLAVGVAFGSIGSSSSATFASAVGLAIGIAIQNFPEGTSVSVPLHRCGVSKMKAFMYGQLSGIVEPVAGVLGCLFVKVATPVLPYALGFAAGAMLFVVIEDIIPEYVNGGRTRLANWCFIVGFLVMMSLDVGLG
eukprot:m.64324 g.64324  ORF g.64324 m.64324 type:complete len:348 (-) comp8110_c0_seq2:112-1155(-)